MQRFLEMPMRTNFGQLFDEERQEVINNVLFDLTNRRYFDSNRTPSATALLPRTPGPHHPRESFLEVGMKGGMH